MDESEGGSINVTNDIQDSYAGERPINRHVDFVNQTKWRLSFRGGRPLLECLMFVTLKTKDQLNTENK